MGGSAEPAPVQSNTPQLNSNNPVPQKAAPSDKPFKDEPFDAGVEADENTDPKKFIEQLTGKLGQSLRKYTEAQGQPDFQLEKFAINSLISATHTSEMDAEDQNDIISKVKKAGQKDAPETPQSDTPSDSNSNSDTSTEPPTNNDAGDNKGDLEELSVFENKDENFFIKPKKLSIFAPEGSEEAKFNKENLGESEKSRTFDKKSIVMKLRESFNQEDNTATEPQVAPEPVVKPSEPQVKPDTKPSRKNKPFLPMPSVQPDPKASK